MDDLTSLSIGYLIVFVNNCFSVLYGQITESIEKKQNLKSARLLVYNCYVVILLMIAIILYTREYEKVMNFDNFTPQFFVYLFLSSLTTGILNGSYFVSNEANSSLFTQLASSCKDIFIFIIAVFLIGDFELNLSSVGGIVLSTAGAAVFLIKSRK